MKRRGYIISALILVIDLLCFSFGGGFIAVIALIYSLGIGEIVARIKSRGVLCDEHLGVKHAKLHNCYLRVRGKAEENGEHLPVNIKVYLAPGEEMNAYCFGARSIGVTEGALNLDNRTVEAMIAHELGHAKNGDSVLNMMLMANCLGIIGVLAFYQFALVAMVYLILIICCLIGFTRFSFFSYFVTNKISGLIKAIFDAIKSVVLKASQLVISAIGRQGEFQADQYAAQLGYAFYLKRFLERFAPDASTTGRSVFEVLYDTHPSTRQRIENLNQWQQSNEQRRLQG